MAGQAKSMTAAVEGLPEQQQPVEDTATGDSPGAEVAIAAYYLWLNRGCPIGSDQEDWFHAEAELKKTVPES